MHSLSRRDLALLVALTLAWGLNWPIMKFGVQDLAPLYYRVLCIAGGLVLLWLYARHAGIDLFVPRSAWSQVVKLAVPNLVVWHVLLVVALPMLPAGRSAILGYTMPVWAVVFGLLFFDERPQPRQWVGVAAAFVGTLLLLSSAFTELAGAPLGTLLILTAAACWGYGTNLMRRHLTALPTLTLTFWMLAVTLAAMLPLTIAFEHHRWRAPAGLCRAGADPRRAGDRGAGAAAGPPGRFRGDTGPAGARHGTAAPWPTRATTVKQAHAAALPGRSALPRARRRGPVEQAAAATREGVGVMPAVTALGRPGRPLVVADARCSLRRRRLRCAPRSERLGHPSGTPDGLSPSDA